MTKQELLESYGFNDLPEELQDKYMKHIVDTIYGATPKLIKKEEPKLTDVRIMSRISNLLVAVRKIEEEVVILAEEMCYDDTRCRKLCKEEVQGVWLP